MTRRRSGTNWSWIRGLIEFNLRQRPEFQKDFRLEEKIQSLGQGLFHRNYLFEAAGEVLVLRLSKVEHGWQSLKDAVLALRKEAKTLQALGEFDLTFEVPKLTSMEEEVSPDTYGLV